MDSRFDSLAIPLGPDAPQRHRTVSLLLAALAATLLGTVPPSVLTPSDGQQDRRTGAR